MKLLTSITVLMFKTSVAMACTYSPSGLAISQLFDFNQRVSAANDCSFANSGPDDNVSGEPVFDLGSGFVSQVVVARATGICSFGIDRTLVISDCSDGSIASVSGIVPGKSRTEGPIVLLDAQTSVEASLAEMGNPTFSDQFGLNEVVDLARSMNIPARIGFNRFDQIANDWDRPDLACGCAQYYPNSAGASQ